MSRLPLLRPATLADVPELERLMLADEGVPPGSQLADLRHVLARGTVVVAEVAAGDGGGTEGAGVAAGGDEAPDAAADASRVIVGFGAAVDSGRSRHLADLFVRRSWQGRGVGQRLLAAVLGNAAVRTTFASDDPRALPLYVRAGMTALWPNLYLLGNPARLPPAPTGHVVRPATLDEMAEAERRWIPVDRRREAAYWSSGVTDPRPFVVLAGDRPVAAGLARDRITGPGRWLDHAVVSPDADPVSALLPALRFGLARTDIGGACVPGPSPLVRVLLDAGFRIENRDTFLASDPAVLDPTREIVNTGFL